MVGMFAVLVLLMLFAAPGSVLAEFWWHGELGGIPEAQEGWVVQIYQDVNGDSVLDDVAFTDSGEPSGAGNSSDDVLLRSAKAYAREWTGLEFDSMWSDTELEKKNAYVYTVLFNHADINSATESAVLDRQLYYMANSQSGIYDVNVINRGWKAVVGAPNAVLISAMMRPGSALMDVVYRVDDSDDSTVKVYPLAFIDGVRSFANVIRPETFVEGTATNVGDTVATGIEHTLTWDVGADWDIDLGQVKFEILCRDGRGLLPIEWITVPAVGGDEEITVSRSAPTDAQLMNALIWLYASGSEDVALDGSVLKGTAASGAFDGDTFVDGAVVNVSSAAFIFKCMDLQSCGSVSDLEERARAGLEDLDEVHAVNQPYDSMERVKIVGTGGNAIPAGLMSATAVVAGGAHNMALLGPDRVVAWGENGAGQCTVPVGLSAVRMLSAGSQHSLALKTNGSVVAWGDDWREQCTVPADLTNAVSVAAGHSHNLAIRDDGTVAAWGWNPEGQCNVPAGLSNVVAVAAGEEHSLALRSDGTAVLWGKNFMGDMDVPGDLTNAVAIAAGYYHCLALRTDGTVTAWGDNGEGRCNVPTGLSNVVAVAAGIRHSAALKDDGTVVVWGDNSQGQCDVPENLGHAVSISSGCNQTAVLITEAP